jgi:hypothetical protein
MTTANEPNCDADERPDPDRVIRLDPDRPVYTEARFELRPDFKTYPLPPEIPGCGDDDDGPPAALFAGVRETDYLPYGRPNRGIRRRLIKRPWEAAFLAGPKRGPNKGMTTPDDETLGRRTTEWLL